MKRNVLNRMYVVYKYRKKSNLNIENPENNIMVTSDTSMVFKKNRKTKTRRYHYAVTAISPTHHESEPLIFKIL